VKEVVFMQAFRNRIREKQGESCMDIYAISSIIPPASLIFFSANFETNLALTITGTSGNLPLPNNFEYPLANKSITGAVSDDPPLKYFSLCSVGTNVHSLSRFNTGFQKWFCSLWK